ncbi:hypothetical protein FRB93_007861 [Tulasnella sp. JGI-2019a]|nr:hypothetical protein FRB93_007861 [Tulasnella sp. JGI-2019a]
MGIFTSRPTYDPASDIPDLKGKVCLVTGGNAGIGYETVSELVKHGTKVYIGARNESRATGAIAKLKAQGCLDGPNAGQVLWLELDLSTPASSGRAAEGFIRRETRLDILVNNAGLAAWGPGAFTLIQGKVPVITIMSTKYISPKPLGPVRAYNNSAAIDKIDSSGTWVASSGHSDSKGFDWKSADGWNFKSEGFIAGIQAYGTTKLANILFAKELQHVFDEQGTNALSITLHPGGVNIDFIQGMKSSSAIGYTLYSIVDFFGFFATPE